MVYLISYDLHVGATRDDYERVGNGLTGAGAQRILLSQWVVRTNATSRQTYDAIIHLFDNNDSLLVTEISTTNWTSIRTLVDLNTV